MPAFVIPFLGVGTVGKLAAETVTAMLIGTVIEEALDHIFEDEEQTEEIIDSPLEQSELLNQLIETNRMLSAIALHLSINQDLLKPINQNNESDTKQKTSNDDHENVYVQIEE